MPNDPLDANTRLAAERTRLAQERTLMAWIRTATALIAFGFTIYQIFRYLSASERLRAPLVSPQIVGVAMIVIGLVALILAWVQHRQAMRALRSDFGPMPGSLAGIFAALIAGLGVIALLGVMLRL
ncbi:YidH family protein [Mycobacterium sp. smrl_JER01]|uniref:YidH family protein n=1 Tax=Mycobacterium sp. smrl_JER01 TaxID=3402633 RepID=UPI003AC29716